MSQTRFFPKWGLLRWAVSVVALYSAWHALFRLDLPNSVSGINGMAKWVLGESAPVLGITMARSLAVMMSVAQVMSVRAFRDKKITGGEIVIIGVTILFSLFNITFNLAGFLVGEGGSMAGVPQAMQNLVNAAATSKAIGAAAYRTWLWGVFGLVLSSTGISLWAEGIISILSIAWENGGGIGLEDFSSRANRLASAGLGRVGINLPAAPPPVAPPPVVEAPEPAAAPTIVARRQAAAGRPAIPGRPNRPPGPQGPGG